MQKLRSGTTVFFRTIIKSRWNQSPLMSQRVLSVRSALSVLLIEASPLPDIKKSLGLEAGSSNRVFLALNSELNILFS